MLNWIKSLTWAKIIGTEQPLVLTKAMEVKPIKKKKSKKKSRKK